MNIKESYFVIALPGTVMVRDGKEIGKAVWLAPETPYDNIENVGGAESRPMIFPDEGKILRNKHTGELSSGCWLCDSTMDDWEEIDRTEVEHAE